MAIVKRQGIWTDASYPWTDQTSAGMMGSIVAEFDAWVSAISGNASIVANGQLPVKLRDPSSSTDGGVTNGFVYEFPDTSIGLDADGPTYPTLMAYGTETSLKFVSSDEYADDASNGGFGDGDNTPGHRVGVTVGGDAGYDRQAIVFYDDTDGEEFFVVGVKVGTSTSENSGLGAFKDTDGHWVLVTGGFALAYDNVLGYWTGSTGPYDTDPVMDQNTSWLGPLVFRVNISAGSISRPGFDNKIQGKWYPANGALHSGLNSLAKLGNYVLTEGGTEAIVMTGYASIAVRVPV